MIDLKTLNRKKLEEFISSGDYKKYDFLPITKHRAISHLRNPKANDEDILLILAFHNDQLAGYLGVFPIILSSMENLLSMHGSVPFSSAMSFEERELHKLY
jgi:hypothetical protein